MRNRLKNQWWETVCKTPLLRFILFMWSWGVGPTDVLRSLELTLRERFQLKLLNDVSIILWLSSKQQEPAVNYTWYWRRRKRTFRFLCSFFFFFGGCELTISFFQFLVQLLVYRHCLYSKMAYPNSTRRILFVWKLACYASKSSHNELPADLPVWNSSKQTNKLANQVNIPQSTYRFWYFTISILLFFNLLFFNFLLFQWMYWLFKIRKVGSLNKWKPLVQVLRELVDVCKNKNEKKKLNEQNTFTSC